MGIAAHTLRIAHQLVPADSAEASLKQIMINEIRRRLNRYELMDQRFRRKYGMSFEEFREQRMVEKEGYSFEVESDFCDWEMAVTGISSLKEYLSELQAQ